jgi:ribonuclease HII
MRAGRGPGARGAAGAGGAIGAGGAMGAGGAVRPVGYTPRRDVGLSAYERVLGRAGLGPVAGVDEAGRGACAGPLVVAAVMLKPSKIAKMTELADSKALTAKARNAAYSQIMDAALDWSVVTIPPGDIDRLGLHVCNVAGMRRALAGLASKPGYVLTDGFPVRGLPAPALAMWKGDQVAACVAAASVIAKVTRDAMMCDLHETFPHYGFARHKGYSTRSHMRALDQHGPCPEHRMSFVNVRGRIPLDLGEGADDLLAPGLGGELGLGLDGGPEGGLEEALRAGLAGEPEDGPEAALRAGQEAALRAGREATEGGMHAVSEAAAGTGGPGPGPDNSEAANSCYPPGTGQNGPIVDIIEEHGWPTAGLAAIVRGA